MDDFSIISKDRKLTLEEKLTLIQQDNVDILNDLINEYQPFVAKTVSSVCKRYIYESDDEFSIGLIAFHEAIKKYDHQKGCSLLSFAEVIIKRKVIDYIRYQSKSRNVSLAINDQEDDASPVSIEDSLSVEEYLKILEIEERREEIKKFSQLLLHFDLSFQALVEHTPKHKDARKSAMSIAKIIADDLDLQTYLFETKKLPIKKLEKKVKVSRKTIERNRKYIVAISLILSGDYIYLKDYIKGVLET
ncbi:RNA polymerase sigma factor SigI [Bacillus sp. 03113]|uniref:RNA polymerase sigma factor SigI n=1 Tax=Bacillus sp. 03113 TaxID=2578211 RepID=UPI00215C627B|nr:RNA polymerase sigma factor SigI [Bacillus sp. 03113]